MTTLNVADLSIFSAQIERLRSTGATDIALAEDGASNVRDTRGTIPIESPSRRALDTLLGANGGYLDTHGKFIGAAGQWSLSAASLFDGPARDADPGTVALLLQKPAHN